VKILIGFLLLIGLVDYAGAFDLKWSQGVVVMVDGEVRQGEVVFQFAEIVLLRSEGEVNVLPANKVQSFRYYDQKENINRNFVSTQPIGKPAAFYEIVVFGEVSVVRKFKPNVLYNKEHSDKNGFDYFVRIQNELVTLKHFRTKVYPTLIEHFHGLPFAISERRLNPNYAGDAIQIIQIYNKETSAETVLVGI